MFLYDILTMLTPTAIFAVIIIFLSAQHAQSRALQSLNIKGILKSLQQQLQLEQLAEKKRQKLSAAILDPEQDYNSNFVRSLNKKPTHQVRDDSDDRDDDDDHRSDQSPQLLQQLGRVYEKQSRDLENLLYKPKSDNSLAAPLDDRSDEDKESRQHKSRSVKKSRPSGSALASLLDDREDESREDHLQDLKSYKSVYLVLDPEAVEKSHNKERLGNLLSKLLNAFRQNNKRDRRERKKDRHHQGFTDDNLSGRRKGHDSKEKYAPDESPERDYKPPKRSRPERSGSGGGAGGRTAIPYRGQHRGDIYERDN